MEPEEQMRVALWVHLGAAIVMLILFAAIWWGGSR